MRYLELITNLCYVSHNKALLSVVAYSTVISIVVMALCVSIVIDRLKTS